MEDVPESLSCALSGLLKFVAREWTADIVSALGRSGPTRFGRLRRVLPGSVSARVLSARLKELESLNIVLRTEVGSLPLHVEYCLTELGIRLDKMLAASEELSSRSDLLGQFNGKHL